MTICDLDRHLLDAFQRDFPLASRPYAVLAAELGMTEAEVMDRLVRLQESGVIDRVGAVVAPNTVGASTLAAMAVPDDRLEEVAAIVSARPEVNHNYEREHDLNLWFVLMAANRADLDAAIRDIERDTGLDVVDLPLEEAFHIDLGFPLEASP